MQKSVTIIIAIVITVAAGSAFGAGKIKIYSSVYQRGNDTNARADCTSQIKQLCDDKESCTFLCNQNICGDPSGPLPKECITSYSCGDQGSQDTTSANLEVILDCKR
jgi:hypothetical protein